MSRPRTLFFTYSRAVPTAQIGVLKRCIRMIDRLDGDIEAHLVNFGPLLLADRLIRDVTARICVHETDSGDLGGELESLIATIRPDVAVFGETPLRGSMRMAHRVATAGGLWQCCIENDYGDHATRMLTSGWPAIDRWMLLGLPRRRAETGDAPCVIYRAPLAARNTPSSADARDRVCCLGYDHETLKAGIAFARLLPADLHVDFLVTAGGEEVLAAAGVTGNSPFRAVHTLPSDEVLASLLARALVAFGKAGFQQIAESLSLGTPIVCKLCGGGVDASALPEEWRPFALFVTETRGLSEVMPQVEAWLRDRPKLPFEGASSDPVGDAASGLRAMLARRDRGAQIACQKESETEQEPLGQLIRRFAAKDWLGIGSMLERASVFCFGKGMAAAEAAKALLELFEQAEDLQLLPMERSPVVEEGIGYRQCVRCCAMWGEVGNWSEHEIEFSLALAWWQRRGEQPVVCEVRVDWLDAD